MRSGGAVCVASAARAGPVQRARCRLRAQPTAACPPHNPTRVQVRTLFFSDPFVMLSGGLACFAPPPTRIRLRSPAGRQRAPPRVLSLPPCYVVSGSPPSNRCLLVNESLRGPVCNEPLPLCVVVLMPCMPLALARRTRQSRSKCPCGCTVATAELRYGSIPTYGYKLLFATV